METIKLYEKDSYLTHCRAIVKEIIQEDKQYLVLDQTVFYPTGGGQPHDIGYINGYQVTDVRSRDEIEHAVEGDFYVGQEVECEIDFDRRFDHMQQHSGEHLLSGIIHSRFGYDNVGFHLGKEEVILDFSGDISIEEAYELEKSVNQAVYQNVKIEIFYLEDKNLSYRQKKELEGDIRIVKMGEYDICACCGTHVASTGEIGIVKIKDVSRTKKGTRIIIVCGNRALSDYEKIEEENKKISVLLSSKVHETSKAVERLLKENQKMHEKVHALNELVAMSIGEGLSGDHMEIVVSDDLDNESALKLLNMFLKKSDYPIMIVEHQHYLLGSNVLDLRDVNKNMRDRFNSKGGGKPHLQQGTIQAARDELIEFFKEEGLYED